MCSIPSLPLSLRPSLPPSLSCQHHSPRTRCPQNLQRHYPHRSVYAEPTGRRWDQATGGSGLANVYVRTVQIANSHCQRRAFFGWNHDERDPPLSLPTTYIHPPLLPSLFIAAFFFLPLFHTHTQRGFPLTTTATSVHITGGGLCDEVALQQRLGYVKIRRFLLPAWVDLSPF